MAELMKYIIALTNLYGMVSKEKVVEIYNSHHQDQASLSEVEVCLQNPPDELAKAFVYPHQGYFVSESILEFDEFEIMLAKKADKPFYVPNQKELLKYIDGCYFEETRQYKALYDYVKKNFYKRDDHKAEMLAEDIHRSCQLDNDFDYILEEFTRSNLSFKDANQVNEVVQLIMDLSNNTRLWENNGHTPQEIFEQFEKPKLRPLPAEPFKFDETDVIDFKSGNKIGRNDPCPCGSGKKFKKCCLNDHEPCGRFV